MTEHKAAPADGLPEELVFRLRKRAEIRRSIPRPEPDRIAEICEEAADEIDALRAKAQALQEQLRNTRWNIREDGDALVVCKGLHDKHEDCEEVRYVPESALAAALEREKAGRKVAEFVADPVPDSEIADEWTKGYEECKRRIKAMLGGKP